MPADVRDRRGARRPQPQRKSSRSSRRPSRHDATRGATGRRLLALLAAAALAFGAITARLVQVQAVSAGRYATVGESQRVRNVVLTADRGSIFDRNGFDLALSVPSTTVWANPRLVTNPLLAANALAPILGEETAVLRDKLSRDAQFVYLKRQVGGGMVKKVQELKLEGIFFMEEPKRHLPNGDLAAAVIGKVGIDNKGLSGLEAQLDKELAGKPGSMVVERAGGHDIPGGLRELAPATAGDDLVLTIDRSLQHETERALASEIVTASAQGGVAIVMETRTGEILAMANMVKGEEEGDAPRAAPHNMALTNAYEPGSINKMITISAALEEGLVAPQTRLTVPSQIRVADHTFTEHDVHPTIQWSITDIMANSSNVGSIMLGQRVGKKRMDSYLRDFGFGSKTGLNFPGESSGIMLDPDKWSGTSIGTIPIGQGVSVTPIQMLAAYNTVANDGVYVAPKLVKATIDAEGTQHATPPSQTRRVVSATTARQVTSMLTEVVRVGTGKLAAIDGYTVAGKTGTARKPLVGARGYEAGAYVSSFAGFVPAERPGLTAIVMLDEPTPIYGGLVAAPVFAEISRYGLRQFKIPPAAPVAQPGVPAASETAVENLDEAQAAKNQASTVNAPRSREP